MAWVEEFAVWTRLGRVDVRRLGAREAEAMLLLERELEEVRRAQQQ